MTMNELIHEHIRRIDAATTLFKALSSCRHRDPLNVRRVVAWRDYCWLREAAMESHKITPADAAKEGEE